MKNLVFLSSLILIMVLGCNQSNLKTEPDDEIISSDPLPSWKDGGNKSAIIDFVKQITQKWLYVLLAAHNLPHLVE